MVNLEIEVKEARLSFGYFDWAGSKFN